MQQGVNQWFYISDPMRTVTVTHCLKYLLPWKWEVEQASPSQLGLTTYETTAQTHTLPFPSFFIFYFSAQPT